MFSEIQQVSLRDRVVNQIRQAIIEGRLKPEDHIVENKLTQQLGVSRTPVREALILLEREGLVITVPNRGCFVRSFVEDDVREIFSMRTNLENFAASLSIDKLDESDFRYLDDMIDAQRKAITADDFKRVRGIDMAFHRFLVQRPRHKLLMGHWEEIVAQIAALLYLRADAFPDYDEQRAIQDHKAIVAAYRARDLDALRAVNQRVNDRVCGECVAAISKLAD